LHAATRLVLKLVEGEIGDPLLVGETVALFLALLLLDVVTQLEVKEHLLLLRDTRGGVAGGILPTKQP
jgi:hypothetical protein